MVEHANNRRLFKENEWCKAEVKRFKGENADLRAAAETLRIAWEKARAAEINRLRDELHETRQETEAVRQKWLAADSAARRALDQTEAVVAEARASLGRIGSAAHLASPVNPNGENRHGGAAVHPTEPPTEPGAL
jgi:uncharacterized protein (DUF3084 family)